jgi:hypothetical protein
MNYLRMRSNILLIGREMSRFFLEVLHTDNGAAQELAIKRGFRV